jgi:hypothetical protein
VPRKFWAWAGNARTVRTGDHTENLFGRGLGVVGELLQLGVGRHGGNASSQALVAA